MGPHPSLRQLPADRRYAARSLSGCSTQLKVASLLQCPCSRWSCLVKTLVREHYIQQASFYPVCAPTLAFTAFPDPRVPEELPVRLAHRIKELDTLPNGLNEMPSINKVKNWYGQSFEVNRTFALGSILLYPVPSMIYLKLSDPCL
jgi:hypothetical protein